MSACCFDSGGGEAGRDGGSEPMPPVNGGTYEHLWRLVWVPKRKESEEGVGRGRAYEAGDTYRVLSG
jgi:hypothetical protein